MELEIIISDFFSSAFVLCFVFFFFFFFFYFFFCFIATCSLFSVKHFLHKLLILLLSVRLVCFMSQIRER